MSAWSVGLTEVSLRDADVEAVLDTLRSGWLTMGPRTQDLEEAFASYTGSAHAIAVSSGGAALHLACAATGIGPGDEVIVPAMSFVADANAPGHCGAEPVMADSISLAEPGIDPADVVARLTPRTRAIVAVHMFGFPADVEALKRVCEEHDLTLIEDCAQADGGRLADGGMAGTVGHVGCFSFFSKTQLGAGEGGILITDDDEIAARVRSLRSHAMTSVTWDRHRGHAETYDVPELGFNYRIDETRASLARSRLGRLDEAVEDLRRVARAYRERLAPVEGVEFPFSDEAVELSGHFAFPVVVFDIALRDAVRARLHASSVQTTFYPALTQLTAFRPETPAGDCPIAEEFADRHLALLLFPGLDEARIDLVVAELDAALRAQ